MMQDTTKHLLFWGKEIDVEFVFTKDGSGCVPQAEESAFEDFVSHCANYDKESLTTLKSYIHANAAEILAYTSLPAIPRDVFRVVTLEAVRLYPSGALAVFCDTSWDSHGLALYYENGIWEAMTPDQLWLRT